ncbi:hypothetical protein OF829_08910 [Sphingomonas sp. LB-2]|uniref:hypothetical protein n=1 Tax=Sphingomonas caeni TaxID=2984949 RepID=UPI002232B2EC|nr:hypothetical protein [Sphingomonas caeni]MCW3847360.1 hypothetical protein [Sphingomonas caeni]
MSTENSSNRKPSHRLYQVSGEGRNAIWTPIASAWVHGDGKGFNILVPFIGKIVMREVSAKGEDDDQGRLV